MERFQRKYLDSNGDPIEPNILLADLDATTLFIPEAKERISERLIVDMLIMGIDFNKISHELQVLEGRQERTTKGPTLFKSPHSPLKGLWHSHYFQGSFIPKNMQNAGVPAKILAKLANENVSYEDRDTIRNIIRTSTEEAYQARKEAQKLTGEWIIFQKHQGQNYYLCIDSHDGGDDKIYQKVLEARSVDFPFLPELQ